ncbi:hypothetical protein MACJ_002992 [Theileria orientalis]|uniref:Uncharacterized protein n=1 Tax=Theileria orientalis TaxID=68886 RepID=A0A976M719_THEOR|nr:hypothetical protein MACJ_002992 [Theileria orientalis]
MNNTKVIKNSQPYLENKTKRVSLRKKIKSSRYAGEEYNWNDDEYNPVMGDIKQIKIEDEKFTWDFFYSKDKHSDHPFSGFDTVETVNIIILALSKLRRKRKNGYALPSEMILEVGHGKFPLIWDLKRYFTDFFYFGIEFSTIAFQEAVKHRFNNRYAVEEAFESNVEFLSAKSLCYFNEDGSNNFDVLFPKGVRHSKLEENVITLALGKCFLDYLSCRLTLSSSLSTWNLDPRIPQGVVDMFDSISRAMKTANDQHKESSLLILIEPDDSVKFRDHIGIIAKVIYTSTFVEDSPSKYFKLVYVHREKTVKAICYCLEKSDSVYKTYDDLRYDICKIAKNSYTTRESTDEDWLLPYYVPSKWLSNDTRDFDNLTLLSKFVLFQDLLKSPYTDSLPYKYERPKYPPYPYYDAPQNLFFDTSKLKDNEGENKDNTNQNLSEIQEEYMKNAKLRRKKTNFKVQDKTPLSELSKSIGLNYNDYILSESKPHKENVKTDLAEYDAINPGFGPWPSYEELKSKAMDVNTSIFYELNPKDSLEQSLQHKPLIRNDIKTIAEAREEQIRWLDRSRNKEWPLTYKEFAALPLDMREAYYENRYPVSDANERFLMILNYRRALENKNYKKNPLEFDLMESDYTYTPKDSPVKEDLKNWDDPLECGWRLRANEAIEDCVSYGWPPRDIRFNTGMGVYDITWLPGVVKVLVERTRDECGYITMDELKLMLMKLEKRLEVLDKEEHTNVMSNHVIVLCTHPEGSSVLHSRREWNENKGKDVTITMNDEERTEFNGVLMGSDSTFGINIKIGDENVTLPLPFVHTV